MLFLKVTFHRICTTIHLNDPYPLILHRVILGSRELHLGTMLNTDGELLFESVNICELLLQTVYEKKGKENILIYISSFLYKQTLKLGTLIINYYNI